MFSKFLLYFLNTVAAAFCATFQIHLPSSEMARTCQWSVKEYILNARVVPTYKAVFTPMVEDNMLHLIHNAS